MKHLQTIIAILVLFTSFENEVVAQTKWSVPSYAAKVSYVDGNGRLNLDPSSTLMNSHSD